MAEQTKDQETKRVAITELSFKEARDSFLKGESYCGFELPTYFKFDTVLSNVSTILNGKSLRCFCDSTHRPRDFDDVNHTVVAEPLVGPLALGFACHYGLGLFAAADDDKHAPH